MPHLLRKNWPDTTEPDASQESPSTRAGIPRLPEPPSRHFSGSPAVGLGDNRGKYAMFCSFCGTRLPDDAVSCPSCGRAIGSGTRPPPSEQETSLGLPSDARTFSGGPPDAQTFAGGALDAGTFAGGPPDAQTFAGGMSQSPAGVGASRGATMFTAGVVTAGGPLAPGTSFGSRYHIIRLLGIGGMGAVYQAWDDALGVAVALKVIRPEITADPAGARDIERRFKRELLLARQVTHKNVVRIHDLGEIEGVKYITMPYIQGSDLASILNQERKLSVARAVAIARQVVSGLQAAHEAGVVHRDLKPANIMIDADDQAVIMDFGIARSVSGGGATVAGAVVGTLEYMAPEQAMAQAVDHRADIYAMGLILYDMVLGPRQSSRAESAVAELMTRVQKPLPPARSIDSSIPEALERIIDRCTQPDPAARYQTTAQLVQDMSLLDSGGRQASGTASLAAPPITRPLEVPAARPASRAVPLKAVIAAGVVLALAAGLWLVRDKLFGARSPGTEPTVALAVLPFRNGTGDASLDWLGSSLADMVGANVGQSARLRPVSPERVSQLLRDLRIGVNTDIDPATIGRVAEFTSADSIVVGRYSRLGEQIRIDARLHSARGGEPIVLSASAAGENDILRAAEDLARDIRRNLALDSAAVTGLKAFRPSSDSVQALRYYGEGVQLARVGEHLEAAKRFEEATKADPKFALAFAQLGQSLASLRRSAEAETATKQALDLSANLPQEERELITAAHARITNDFDTAIASYERLLETRPTDVQLRFELAGLLDSNGALERAKDEYAKVLEADPKFPEALYAAGRNAILRSDYKGSLDWLSPAEILAVQLDNREAQAKILHALGVAYKELGRLDDAARKYEESLAIKRQIGDKGGIAQSLNELAQIHHRQGRSEAALQSYEEALESYRSLGDKRGIGIALGNLGVFYFDRGLYDEALTAFKEALPIQRELGDDQRQALCLSNIGTTLSAKAEYQEASIYLERALELEEKSEAPASIALALANLAEVSTVLGEFDRAEGYYLRAIRHWREAGDDKRGAVLGSVGMGILRTLQGRYGAALEAQAEALKNVKELNEKSLLLAQALIGSGAAQSPAGRFQEAVQSLEEGLTVARDLKNETVISQALNLKGDNAYYQGDSRGARVLYEQARESARRGFSRYDALRAGVNLARLDAADGQPPAAVSALKKLMSEVDAIGLKSMSAECSLYLGAALIRAKNIAEARRELESAVTKSEKLGARALVARSHHLLGEALRMAGNTSAAATHHARAQKELDAIRAELRNDSVLARHDLKPILQRADR